MKTGTEYFPSYGAAMRYYRPCVGDILQQAKGTTLTEAVRQAVNARLNEGAIHIGKPPLKPGETLTIEDNRYHITETQPHRPAIAARDSGVSTAADAPGFHRGPMGKGKPKVARIYSVVGVAADGTAECQSWDCYGVMHTDHLAISTLVPFSKQTP